MTAPCDPFNCYQVVKTARVQPITTLNDTSISTYNQACRNDHELLKHGWIPRVEAQRCPVVVVLELLVEPFVDVNATLGVGCLCFGGKKLLL